MRRKGRISPVMAFRVGSGNVAPSGTAQDPFVLDSTTSRVAATAAATAGGAAGGALNSSRINSFVSFFFSFLLF